MKNCPSHLSFSLPALSIKSCSKIYAGPISTFWWKGDIILVKLIIAALLPQMFSQQKADHQVNVTNDYIAPN